MSAARVRVLVVLSTAAAALGVAAPAAHAAFPGRDGRIATTIGRPFGCGLGFCATSTHLASFGPVFAFRRDVHGATNVLRPATSPDGTQAAAVVDVRDSVRDQIRTGTPDTQLTTTVVDGSGAPIAGAVDVSYAPTGGLVIVRDDNALLLQAAPGEDPRTLATLPAGYAFPRQAKVSPDGATLAVQATDADGYPRILLFRASDGTLLRSYKPAGNGFYVDGFDWSPDAKRIVVSGGADSLRLLDPATGGEQTVTGAGLVGVRDVAWAPSGTRFAVILEGDGTYAVGTVTTAGTTFRRLATSRPSVSFADLEWSKRP